MRADEADIVLKDLQQCEDALQRLRRSVVKLIDRKVTLTPKHIKSAVYSPSFYSPLEGPQLSIRLTSPIEELHLGKGEQPTEVVPASEAALLSPQAACQTRQNRTPIELHQTIESLLDEHEKFMSNSKYAEFWENREDEGSDARRATATTIGSGKMPLARQFLQETSSFESTAQSVNDLPIAVAASLQTPPPSSASSVDSNAALLKGPP